MPHDTAHIQLARTLTDAFDLPPSWGLGISGALFSSHLTKLAADIYTFTGLGQWGPGAEGGGPHDRVSAGAS